jgi:NifB/MoaA-like Fe-S oxidoreductase
VGCEQWCGFCYFDLMELCMSIHRVVKNNNILIMDGMSKEIPIE